MTYKIDPPEKRKNPFRRIAWLVVIAMILKLTMFGLQKLYN